MRNPRNERLSSDIAEAGPERTCILSGEAAPRDALIRLAISPDGLVLPDVLAKAPGRGAWIGVSRADITPDKPVWLTGYAARKTRSTGVEHPIYVKVIVIEEDEGEKAVIYTCDLIGLHKSLTEEIAEKILYKAKK